MLTPYTYKFQPPGDIRNFFKELIKAPYNFIRVSMEKDKLKKMIILPDTKRGLKGFLVGSLISIEIWLIFYTKISTQLKK